ncbi:hypothetical protein FNV43_RR06736 [Rhamnella rubrinervis]|uniref:Early flowering 3 n=1 Tax=Rhamnella rubrinervis TaxID=2594499 RepID=A0A8K0HDH7_9ROSA|nr:hypothetical protein FNV43_RR06736 [Rhamnella rubrinervis]
MRGGKDEEKMMSPMFPRLHVNDTEKGGPRAPPRNKMALYEQLSIPSQKPTSGSAPMSPTQQNKGRSLVPSTSSSHVAAYQSMFTPFRNSSVPSYMGEKLPSNSSSGTKLNTVVSDHEIKCTKPTNYHSSNGSGPFSSTAKCDSSQKRHISNFKNFSFRKFGKEDDFTVPTSAQEKASHFNTGHQNKERETLPHLSLKLTVQQKSSCEKQMRVTSDLKSRHFARNHTKDNPKIYRTNQNPVERSASVSFVRDKNFEDVSSSPPTTLNSKTSKLAHASLNQEHKSSSMDNLNELHGTSAESHEECLVVCDKTTLRDDILGEPTRGMVRDISSKVKVRRELCSRTLLGGNSRSADGIENGSELRGEKNCWTLQVGNVNRRDDVSETSMVDGIFHPEVSPDDVVGMIGEKQFLKARRVIVNQQRIFAVQVFELHRLIKVQRLMAESPHLLNEDDIYLRKPALEISSMKRISVQYILDTPNPIVKSRDNPQKPNPSTERADENVVRKFPLPSVNNDTSRGLVTEQSNYAKNSRNPPPAPPTNNNKPAQWCIHPPPGNQWLVPVMSPSEGLVYKPYTGVCLPTAGCVAPMYGSCGPVSLNPGNGDLLNAAYGFPPSNHPGIGIVPGTHPLGQTYFPPYGMPVTNPSISGSAVKQMSPFGGGRSNEQENQLSIGEINLRTLNQSSCNMSSQMSRVMSCRVEKFQAPKGSELQGSTASSPSETLTTKVDALPLFPTAPTVQESDQNTQTTERQIRVIKVVPHNPRSATESAARIFQSIQEERKRL